LLLLLLLRPASVALALLLPLPAPFFATLFFPSRFAGAGALFELPHLLFHVAARLLVELRTHLVMPAVRAALPPLGIRPFAPGAQD
jgi:hypothetical protein